MQKVIKIFFVALTFLWSSHLIAQSPKNNEMFIQEIDITVQQLKNKPIIHRLKKGRLSQKTKIVGDFDNNSKHFKRKIKVKNGVIVEKIRIKKKGVKGYKKYLDIILINAEYFYIKRTNYSADLKIKDSNEVFIDGNIYRQIKKGFNWY